MNTKVFSLFGLVALLIPPFAQAQVISDNFDSYADQAAFNAVWTPFVNNCILTNSPSFSSPQSVYQRTAASQVYRTNAPTATADLKLSFWFYDSGPAQGRSYVEMTAATTSPKVGWLQLVAIGKYLTPATSKYHGRVANGGTNWFILNAAADRSVGWHFLEIIGRPDNWADFKVDGVVGGSAYIGPFNFNWVDIGCNYTTATDAWYDDVNMGPIAPVIIRQPTNQTVAMGNPATFTVVASGSGQTSMTYQWFQDGTPIPSANESSYTTPQTACLDGGTFWVQCDNGSGVTTSQQAILTVRDMTPPAIVCPVDVTYQATSADGSGVNYFVTATDNCDPSPVIVCNPPSGSNFVPGTTPVVCTAADASGNTNSCTFRFTITPLCTDHFFMANLFPPTNGIYLDRGQGLAQFGNGVVVRNTGWKLFSAAVPPPPPGAPVFHTFSSSFEFEMSVDGGLTYAPYTADARNTLRINYLAPDGDGSLYDIAIPQFDVSGGDLPSGILLRASPTQPSDGQTRILPVPGGNMICSFFNIFMEVSLDGGVTWSPAQAPAQVQLNIDPQSVPAMVADTPLQPPLVAGYKCMCTTMGWCHTAPGVWLKGCHHSLFSDATLPPLPGVTNLYSYSFQWDFQLSTDGGLTVTPGRAPATATVRIAHVRDFSGKSIYQTEIIDLKIIGGDLPGGVVLRTKPGRVSEGGICLAPTPPGGPGYTLNSFFDIFTEISTDDGLTWQPLNDGPCHVVAQPLAPQHTFSTPLWPPITGEWATASQLSLASGIIISNLALNTFDATFPPPALGASETHSCQFVATMMLSIDAGLTFLPVEAPGTQTFSISSLQDSDLTRFFNTEILSLNVSDGSLPAGLLLRESPTRQSVGQLSETAPVDGGYRLSSFWDVYYEASLDGGQTWSLASSGPLNTYLRPSHLPVITQEPTNTAVLCGSNVTFCVVATEDPTLTYQWTLYGTQLQDDTNACLTLSNVNLGMNGNLYQVIVRNSNGFVVSAPAILTVYDNVPPTIVCPADIIANTALEKCTALVDYPAPDAWDTCGQVSLICDPPSGSTFPLGKTPVQCTATDDTGNTSTCNFTISVLDTELPLIVCPTEVKAEAETGLCGAHVQYALPEARDNCTILDVECAPPSGSLFSVGSTAVTCTATDQSGNASSCNFNVTVSDLEPPTLICPPNQITNTLPGECSGKVNYAMPAAADNCTITNIDCIPAPLSIFPLGSTPVLCTASDASGNLSRCTFSVTVLDNEPPQIICPPDQTVSTEIAQCSAPIQYPAPQASDNCTIANIVCNPPSGSAFPFGSTSVLCTAFDESGNSNSCTFTVTVNDTELPRIFCPPDITVFTEPGDLLGRCYNHVDYPLSQASDNCSVTNITCTPPPHSEFPTGANPVQCTATDSSGNAASCSFTITVIDNEPPIFHCPNTIEAATDPGFCTKSNVTWTAHALDNCAVTNEECTPPSGSTFPQGVTSVLCVATDSSGNISRCSFIVIIRDLEPPSITSPADIAIGTDPGLCAKNNVTWIATTTDNCSGVSVVCNPPNGSTFPKGDTLVTCTATDAAANTNSCSFWVTVRDFEPPRIYCPQGMAFPADSGQCSRSNVFWQASASDNCDEVALTCNPPSGSSFPIGVTSVLCWAIDGSANSNSCNFTVTVRDTELPQITCPSDLCVLGYAPTGAVVNYPLPNVSENCGGATVDCTPPSESLFPLGTTTVTCVATNTSANSTSCKFTVHVATPCPKLEVSLRQSPQIPGAYDVWVCWPADNSGCLLQYTDSLTPPIVWHFWDGPLMNQDGNYCIRVPNPTGNQFFRLLGNCAFSP